MVYNVLVDNRTRWLDKDASPVFSLIPWSGNTKYWTRRQGSQIECERLLIY